MCSRLQSRLLALTQCCLPVEDVGACMYHSHCERVPAWPHPLAVYTYGHEHSISRSWMHMSHAYAWKDTRHTYLRTYLSLHTHPTCTLMYTCAPSFAPISSSLSESLLGYSLISPKCPVLEGSECTDLDLVVTSGWEAALAKLSPHLSIRLSQLPCSFLVIHLLGWPRARAPIPAFKNLGMSIADWAGMWPPPRERRWLPKGSLRSGGGNSCFPLQSFTPTAPQQRPLNLQQFWGRQLRSCPATRSCCLWHSDSSLGLSARARLSYFGPMGGIQAPLPLPSGSPHALLASPGSLLCWGGSLLEEPFLPSLS